MSIASSVTRNKHPVLQNYLLIFSFTNIIISLYLEFISGDMSDISYIFDWAHIELVFSGESHRLSQKIARIDSSCIQHFGTDLYRVKSISRKIHYAEDPVRGRKFPQSGLYAKWIFCGMNRCHFYPSNHTVWFLIRASMPGLCHRYQSLHFVEESLLCKSLDKVSKSLACNFNEPIR